MTLQIWVCLIRVISPYSNGAVQIRVGLELADNSLEYRIGNFGAPGSIDKICEGGTASVTLLILNELQIGIGNGKHFFT